MRGNARGARQAQGRTWKKPGEFAAVDPDAKEKAVDRAPQRPEADAGRRPNGGRDTIDRLGMSKGMQKRIARARAEGERIGRQNQAERDAEHQREISDLRKKVHGLTIGGKLSEEERKHNQDLAELEAALEKAHADGDHPKIASVTRAMQEKTNAWETRKRELLATPVEASTERRQQATGPTPEGSAWIAANREWYGRPGYEAETSATIAIDERLIAQGSNPNSPEHYKAIQKELKKKFREIDVISPYGDDERRTRREERDEDDRDVRRSRKREDDDEEDDEDDDPRADLDDEDGDDDSRGEDDDDEDDEREEAEDRQRQRARPPSMNFEDSGDRGKRQGLKVRNGRIILSQKDRENMARFSLDPDNDAHVQQYARTKREIANDEDN